MTVRPAAGPLTDSGDRDNTPTTMPPAIPAIRPEKSGAPDASATPRHNGSATSATTIDAGMSARRLIALRLAAWSIVDLPTLRIDQTTLSNVNVASLQSDCMKAVASQHHGGGCVAGGRPYFWRAWHAPLLDRTTGAFPAGGAMAPIAKRRPSGCAIAMAVRSRGAAPRPNRPTAPIAGISANGTPPNIMPAGTISKG